MRIRSCFAAFREDSLDCSYKPFNKAIGTWGEVVVCSNPYLTQNSWNSWQKTEDHCPTKTSHDFHTHQIIPWDEKLLPWMLEKLDVREVNFLTNGDLEYTTPTRRYVMFSQWKRSAAMVCHGLGGTSCKWRGCFDCALWCFRQVEHSPIRVSMSLFIPIENMAVWAKSLNFSIPWCAACSRCMKAC